MNRIARWSVALTLLLFGATVGVAKAQNAGSPAATSASHSTLSPVDYNFVAQANLGAPFQVDSGRLAETKAATAHLRDYAHLMVVSHIPVIDDLNAILKQKGVTAPPNTLLHAAYDTMIASLKAENGAAFDRDYVNGQVDYQKGNAALFQYEIQNGIDPELKEFARRTLPKIEDHLQRALRLTKTASLAPLSNTRRLLFFAQGSPLELTVKAPALIPIDGRGKSQALVVASILGI
jgi:putative membrane protein